MHNGLRRRKRGKCHGGKGVHDEVDPQHLGHRKRALRPDQCARQHDEAGCNIHRHLEENKPLYVLIERTAPHHRPADGTEGVVDDGDVRCLLGNARTVAHRQADVGSLQGRRIIRTVAGDSHHLVLRLQCFDQPPFIHRTRTGDNLQTADTTGEFGIAECFELRSGDDIAVAVTLGPQSHLPPDFLGSTRRIARHNLHVDARIEAFTDGCRHLLAYRVGNRHDALEDKSVRLFFHRVEQLHNGSIL